MMVEGSGGTWWHFIWNGSIGVAGRVMHERPQVTAPATPLLPVPRGPDEGFHVVEVAG